MARRLRSETTTAWGWIASGLRWEQPVTPPISQGGHDGAKVCRMRERPLSVFTRGFLRESPGDGQPFGYAHRSNKVFPGRDGGRYVANVNRELKTKNTKEQVMKKLLRIHQSSGMHWVGN